MNQSRKNIQVKVGDKYELAEGQDMWKDDKSDVCLIAPGLARITKPQDRDYRSQLEWFTSKSRFNNKDSFLFEETKGNPSFEITKGMDVSRIKVAIEKGILVPFGTVKKKLNKKEAKSLFRTDPLTGQTIYSGPNKSIWNLLQKNKEKELLDTIEKIKDPTILETMLNMEQKGWNPASSPRMHVIEMIEKQMKENAIGITSITEEDTEISNLGKEIRDNK